jgi:hypothetical protein
MNELTRVREREPTALHAAFNGASTPSRQPTSQTRRPCGATLWGTCRRPAWRTAPSAMVILTQPPTTHTPLPRVGRPAGPHARPHSAPLANVAGDAGQRTSTQQTSRCPRPLLIVREFGCSRPGIAHHRSAGTRREVPPDPATALRGAQRHTTCAVEVQLLRPWQTPAQPVRGADPRPQAGPGA